MTRMNIEGVVLFSVTPVAADGSIDYTRWKKHLDDALAAGIHSVTLFGSTGANGYFTEAEKMKALEEVATHLGGRVPVMTGIGAMTTAESVRLAKHAADHGADAVLVVPLNYWKPTEREIIAHYETVAAASDLPLWLYNNPPLAGIDLTPALVKTLSSIPTLVGMKDSSGDLSRAFMVPKITGGKVQVGIGQDTLILEPTLAIAPAWFTGLANICPAECVAFWNAAKAGDVAAAYAAAARLFPLSEIGGRYGIIRVAHEGLALMGKSAGYPRPPLLPLEAAAAAEVKAALDALAA
ncbi:MULTISPECIES: dihydrodipicolinate synthase family protein [Xanthobacter]|uniref:Dihydrodipicolinate synthase family protein n=1 Tax=Xanthobacter aminoxidans TaxID=186280 RepID=A0ABW6ZBT3_9HYPH|nr:dihydrodipicolinate synthase family protein [Xanthobacter sp. 91]